MSEDVQRFPEGGVETHRMSSRFFYVCGSCANIIPCILFVIQSGIWLLALYSFPLDGCQHLVKRVAQMTRRQRRVVVDSDVLQKYVFFSLVLHKSLSFFSASPFSLSS